MRPLRPHSNVVLECQPYAEQHAPAVGGIEDSCPVCCIVEGRYTLPFSHRTRIYRIQSKFWSLSCSTFTCYRKQRDILIVEDTARPAVAPIAVEKISYIGGGAFGVIGKDEEGKPYIVRRIPYETGDMLKAMKEYVSSLRS